MNRHRFVAHGTITNYEIQPLREDPPPPRTRWMFIWGSLSERFHPRSQEEWDARDRDQTKER